MLYLNDDDNDDEDEEKAMIAVFASASPLWHKVPKIRINRINVMILGQKPSPLLRNEEQTVTEKEKKTAKISAALPIQHNLLQHI